MVKEKNTTEKKVGGLSIPAVTDDWTSVMVLTLETTPESAFICNWDYTDPELAPLLFMADKPSQSSGNELGGMQIDLAYWICTRIKIPDRQAGGECFVVRTVMISPDHHVVSTLSVGILKSIELLRRQVGTGPINPPIRMVVVGSKMKAGSDMLTLAPVAIEKK